VVVALGLVAKPGSAARFHRVPGRRWTLRWVVENVSSEWLPASENRLQSCIGREKNETEMSCLKWRGDTGQVAA